MDDCDRAPGFAVCSSIQSKNWSQRTHSLPLSPYSIMSSILWAHFSAIFIPPRLHQIELVLLQEELTPNSSWHHVNSMKTNATYHSMSLPPHPQGPKTPPIEAKLLGSGKYHYFFVLCNYPIPIKAQQIYHGVRLCKNNNTTTSDKPRRDCLEAFEQHCILATLIRYQQYHRVYIHVINFPPQSETNLPSWGIHSYH